jgi:hypothetical protein
MARPRALDDTKRREVCALIAAGCSFDSAARYVGCTVITIRREALRNAEFHEQLREAELACQTNSLRTVRRHAETHWRAAAWLLERTDPENFGRRKPIQLTPAQLDLFLDSLVGIVEREVDDEDALRRVYRGFRAYCRENDRRMWAIKAPRREPYDRRARRPVSPQPVDENRRRLPSPSVSDKT